MIYVERINPKTGVHKKISLKYLNKKLIFIEIK